jgi:hypothetical protein
MPKLSDTQAVLLTAAAARPDLSLLPIPETIKANGVALDRTLKSLLSRSLATENTVAGRAKRSKRASSSLAITPVGLAAIGVEVPEAAHELPTVAVPAERPGGKLGLLLETVAQPRGATLDKRASKAGWLPHTTRAAITRLRQRGYDIQLSTVGDRRSYRLDVPA